MAKIETYEDSYACSTLGEWTIWTSHRGNYYTGICHTNLGVIELYHQVKDEEDEDYAWARIICKGRIRCLKTDDKVTRFGWTRIAKKWAKNIWKANQ